MSRRRKSTAPAADAKQRRAAAGGRYVEDGINITISTRHPDKWRFVDIETNQVWRFDPDAKGKPFKIAGVAIMRLGICSKSEKSQTVVIDSLTAGTQPKPAAEQPRGFAVPRVRLKR